MNTAWRCHIFLISFFQSSDMLPMYSLLKTNTLVILDERIVEHVIKLYKLEESIEKDK